MGDDHAHAHSHGGGADASGNDHAHGHGHAHGDAGAHDPTPYVATSAKDGIVYYQAPDGRVLHSHDGCARANTPRTERDPERAIARPPDAPTPPRATSAPRARTRGGGGFSLRPGCPGWRAAIRRFARRPSRPIRSESDPTPFARSTPLVRSSHAPRPPPSLSPRPPPRVSCHPSPLNPFHPSQQRTPSPRTNRTEPTPRLKPHSHDPIPHAGSFRARRPPLRRDYADRAFTVGVGGPVGTGKTALMLSLCRHLRDRYDIAAITNDIFTREDGEYLTKHGALDADRIRAVETGGCPHAAIREDVSANLTEAEALTRLHGGLDFILLESGGDNLAANFSRELADFIVYVIDVCGGDKIPRKGGPGVTQADLLVINKVELADAVGASLEVMARDAKKQRESGPLVMANVKRSVGVPEIAEHVIAAWTNATGGKKEKARDGADEGEKAREAKKAKA